MGFWSNPYLYMALTALAVKIYIGITLGRHWRPGLDLFLVFLVCSGLQTLFEITNFILLSANKPMLIDMVMDGYYLTLIATVVLLPFSVAAIIGEKFNAYFVIGAIVVFAMMTVMLLGSNLLIQGYEPITYSYTRVAGEYYWTFQVLILTTYFYNATMLYQAYKATDQELIKVKCANMLFGFVWLLGFVIIIVFTMQFGVKLNAAGIFPIVMSVYLIFMSINIRDDRVFDIRSKLPWTEQYKLIQQVIRPYQYKTVEPIDSKELTKKYNHGLIDIARSTFATPEQQAEWLGVSRTTVIRRKQKK